MTESLPAAPVLVLYGRGYCHLCDDMAAALEPLRPLLGFELTKVDVDSDPALEEHLGERVPVLSVRLGQSEVEICHYFLDETRLREVLTAIR